MHACNFERRFAFRDDLVVKIFGFDNFVGRSGKSARGDEIEISRHSRRSLVTAAKLHNRRFRQTPRPRQSGHSKPG